MSLSRIRVGNNINVEFLVLADGVPANISPTCRINIRVRRDSAQNSPLSISNTKITGSVVSFTVTGNLRHPIGDYRAEIQYFKDNGNLPDISHAVDDMAFTLVPTTAEQAMGEAEGVVIETIFLTGNIIQGGCGGQNGITPHIGDNGNWWIGTQDTGVRAEGRDGQDFPAEWKELVDSFITDQVEINEQVLAEITGASAQLDILEGQYGITR